jgi:hypothetical protein
MKLPCEIIVWDILPSIRSELAKKLSEKGLSQKEIAKKLEITQAAVSQYVNRKRGCEIEFKRDVISAIEKLVDDMIEGDVNLIPRICEICMRVREDGTVCGLENKECDTRP